MSYPKEAKLQSPFPSNGANLLSLQETLLGCISEMPGNFTNLAMVHSIMGVRLDQDEYLTNWTVYSRLSRDIKQYKALKRCNQIGCVSNRIELIT